jgi:hypothetical protein
MNNYDNYRESANFEVIRVVKGRELTLTASQAKLSRDSIELSYPILRGSSLRMLTTRICSLSIPSARQERGSQEQDMPTDQKGARATKNGFADKRF